MTLRIGIGQSIGTFILTAIANPKLNTANGTIWIGLIRTSFTF
ncbi:hypothetical protein [Nostoc sp.]